MHSVPGGGQWGGGSSETRVTDCWELLAALEEQLIYALLSELSLQSSFLHFFFSVFSHHEILAHEHPGEDCLPLSIYLGWFLEVK